MKTPDFSRLVLALAGAGAAGFLTWLLGAPLEACLPAVMLGGFFLWSISAPPELITAQASEPVDSFEVSRPMLAQLIDSAAEPVLLIERQLVTQANEAAQELLGRHVLGEDVRLAIRHPAAAERLTRHDREDDAPVQLVGLGDAERRWEMTVHAVDENRRIVRLLDRTTAYLAERMRVDFVANASHELRTPLATLLGFLETLQDEKTAADPPTRTRFLKIMFDEARRMQRLVEDLISLSRIEGEKFFQPSDNVSLAPLLSEVADAIREERVAITPPVAPLVVRGDRAQLSQLLHNLIGNAIKYGQPGTPIAIRTSRDNGEMIRIEVADQGEGIAPEHLPRLTERFYRVDPGRSRAQGGTGLGLAIVKHIVERHRGRLDIVSRPGVGTTVSVLLPTAAEPLS